MLFLKQPLILPFLCHKPATACQIDSKKVFFYIHIENYNTCYIYVLLYFLITLQQYNTTGTRPQGARENDYPVAINIKTGKKKTVS